MRFNAFPILAADFAADTCYGVLFGAFSCLGFAYLQLEELDGLRRKFNVYESFLQRGFGEGSSYLFWLDFSKSLKLKAKFSTAFIGQFATYA